MKYFLSLFLLFVVGAHQALAIDHTYQNYNKFLKEQVLPKDQSTVVTYETLAKTPEVMQVVDSELGKVGRLSTKRFLNLRNLPTSLIFTISIRFNL